uniref:Uncharacterized protein n=1 Tax=Arundo donax TaxID=35708 RepID=A0A0A9AEP6_ARUDO
MMVILSMSDMSTLGNHLNTTRMHITRILRMSFKRKPDNFTTTTGMDQPMTPQITSDHHNSTTKVYSINIEL